MLELNAFWERLRSRPDFAKAGMVLLHVGVVRSFSRDGRPVQKVKVRVDHEKLAEIVSEARKQPGIIAVEVECFEGERLVGEPLMLLAVAGDFRENVIQTLSRALDRIKAEATSKEEAGVEA